MNEKSIVDEFNKGITQVIKLLESDKEEEARVLFNEKIYPKYKDKIIDENNPLIFVRIFFVELDEYLNNKAARLIGMSKKENIIDSFYSDYKEDLELARQKEKASRKADS